MTDIKFKIGQEYENRKGVYEVLRVDKDAMSIRWENGEEVTTTEDLQGRIIESMYRELACIKTKKGGKSRQPSPLKYVINFEGMKEGDFSEDITGATWRHYNSLGGAVAVRLKSDKFDIVSWPGFGLSLIYWADLNHRYCNACQPQARFFARLDASCFYFGLEIEPSSPEQDATDERNAFIAWLVDPENDSWLSSVVAEHDLSICDAKKEASPSWTVTLAGEKLLLNGEDQEKEVESLANFLDGMMHSSGRDLQIVKTVKKEDVMKRGTEIADDIVGLFQVLMPVYEATSATTCP